MFWGCWVMFLGVYILNLFWYSLILKMAFSMAKKKSDDDFVKDGDEVTTNDQIRDHV